MGVAPEMAEEALAMWLARLGGDSRAELPFGPDQPAPDGATAADRLAAFLGRRVPVR